MQKDTHFYLTYAIARQIGIDKDVAERIAWADQFTDELTEGDIHGIQTQSAVLGNWDDAQIQMSVLVPFHFLPGDSNDHPWMTTPDSTRAKILITEALESGDEYRLGIALHTYQDTFSHQGFSGWREELNSCFPWYAPISSLPNIGHAEMRATPDIVSTVWTDPRNNELVKNWERATDAAHATFRALERWHLPNQPDNLWGVIKPKLVTIFKTPDYSDRKAELVALSGDAVSFTDVAKRLMKPSKPRFIAAAAGHLADVIERLPWTPPRVRSGRGMRAAAAPPAMPPGTVPFSVTVSPNPFHDRLKVTVAGDRGNAVITIDDRMGNEVAKLVAPADFWTPGAEDEAGVYLVKVKDDAGIVTKAVFYRR